MSFIGKFKRRPKECMFELNTLKLVGVETLMFGHQWNYNYTSSSYIHEITILDHETH